MWGKEMDGEREKEMDGERETDAERETDPHVTYAERLCVSPCALRPPIRVRHTCTCSFEHVLLYHSRRVSVSVSRCVVCLADEPACLE